MTREEIMQLGIEEVEARSAAIAEETATADEARLAELNTELDYLEERKAQILAEIENRKKDVEAVIGGEGVELTEEKEDRTMTDKEIRSSKAYVDSYVDYIKGKNDGSECRSMLTENVQSGTVPVPTYVEGRIQTAWENDEIVRRVYKTFVKGNLKVGVEMSATGAVEHVEGADAPDEETLVLAIVNLIPTTIKKWITASTEVMDLTGEAFLDYLYDEITYQIVKAEAAKALYKVAQAPTSGTSAPIVAEDSISALGLADIVTAIGELGAGARDIVFIANRATIAAYQALALAGNYAFDIFAGATVIPTDILPGFAAASSSDIFAFVGDLRALHANYPAGDEVKFVFDPYSLAESDLVKIVGRQLMAVELVRNNAFTRLVKA